MDVKKPSEQYDYDKLNQKYHELLKENRILKAEIRKLKGEIAFSGSDPSGPELLTFVNNMPAHVSPASDSLKPDGINKNSRPEDKVSLFMSLFRGRGDVYAKRWENRAGRKGYSPVCLNEWKPGLCEKPRKKCASCKHRVYEPLTKRVVENHLRGLIIHGIYPLCEDDTCHFLAMDFDDDGWRQDVDVVREVCGAFHIPVSVERSMSGNGAHAWFFFEIPVAAVTARKFGSALLTHAMEKRHEIRFKSYDRLFPSQDVMPKGGLGNLIAAPLQMEARKKGNSLFVDESLVPYEDQWRFLSQIQKMDEKGLSTLIRKLSPNSELGYLKEQDTADLKPWKPVPIQLSQKDFPENIQIVQSGMLYIHKKGFSHKALNILKRMAAFHNPEFYKAQAMRLSTYGKPRVFSCSDDLGAYLALPRGCETDLRELVQKHALKAEWMDEMQNGQSIQAEFKGVLRAEQHQALNAMIEHRMGVLSATTAFGKTVVAAALIAARKVNTLVLVHRQQLLSQWVNRLTDFLALPEEMPNKLHEKRRKWKVGPIGILGAGKNRLTGAIDVAIMQSLNSGKKVKECIQDYGMVIVDECHHVPAFSFEQILKKVKARYVHGLTATTLRRDGRHPILFFQCGPTRFTVDAKKQALERPFDHFVIPRFTSFRIPLEMDGRDTTIHDIYSELAEDEIRNELIVEDVLKCHEAGRNSLILTGRVAHVETLAEKLRNRIPNVMTLTGGMGARKTEVLLEKLSSSPPEDPLMLVATGKFVGEGFDEPRLDTLFLAMPISWKGTLQQYAGRLHRLYDGKKEVQVYDYVDIHVPMLERMYGKRLKGYASIGYRAKGESISGAPADIIFNEQSFFEVYVNDMQNAKKEILVVSPFVMERRVIQIMPYFESCLASGVHMGIIVRPPNTYEESKQPVLNECFKMLSNAGVNVIFERNIHQKFAVIDRKVVWYGSVNLLGFGRSRESMMRLVSGGIAHQLVMSINAVER